MAHSSKVTPGKVLRAARKTTRRQDYSSSTKRALLDSAAELFTNHGYAGTSLDEVVAAARVTKGALYHHFPSKLALFESVYHRIQEDALREAKTAIDKAKDPWERAQAGLEEFMRISRQPQYRRICMQEAPVALGHERWNESEREAMYGIVSRIVKDLLASMGDGAPLADALSAIFWGAISAAAEFVSDAEDPEHAEEQVKEAIATILAGMQVLPTLAEG